MDWAQQVPRDQTVWYLFFVGEDGRASIAIVGYHSGTVTTCATSGELTPWRCPTEGHSVWPSFPAAAKWRAQGPLEDSSGQELRERLPAELPAKLG